MRRNTETFAFTIYSLGNPRNTASGAGLEPVANYATGDAISVRLNVASVLNPKSTV